MAKAAAKIHGNIYTYWAFHDVLIQHKLISAEASERVVEKTLVAKASRNKVLHVGLVFVMIAPGRAEMSKDVLRFRSWDHQPS